MKRSILLYTSPPQPGGKGWRMQEQYQEKKGIDASFSSHEMPDRRARGLPCLGWTCRWLVVGLSLFTIVAFGGRLPAQTLRPVVYVVPINGVIGLTPFVGCVDAAVLIRDALLRARVRTVAFVNERAMAEALRQGNLGIMDYYRMKSVQADTDMRKAIAVGVARRHGVAEAQFDWPPLTGHQGKA